jgi:hypothetical protein
MGRHIQTFKLNLTYTVVEGDAQRLGALGRVLGHVPGHLLSRQLLVVASRASSDDEVTQQQRERGRGLAVGAVGVEGQLLNHHQVQRQPIARGDRAGARLASSVR